MLNCNDQPRRGGGVNRIRVSLQIMFSEMLKLTETWKRRGGHERSPVYRRLAAANY